VHGVAIVYHSSAIYLASLNTHGNKKQFIISVHNICLLLFHVFLEAFHNCLRILSSCLLNLLVSNSVNTCHADALP
jgi:hypothetical protein